MRALRVEAGHGNVTRQRQTLRGSEGGWETIRAAADYGIDITQLRDNLALPVAERLRRQQSVLNTVERPQKAKRL